MPRNTSVTLGDHFMDFIDAQVQAGRYGSASEVVRAGLRLLEDHEAKIEALRAELIKGEESGPAEPFDSEAFLEEMHQKYAERREKVSAVSGGKDRS